MRSSRRASTPSCIAGSNTPVAALAVALGDVHRGVGVADQLVGVGARSSAEIEMPMLPRSVSSRVAGAHRLRERLEHALGGVGGLLDVRRCPRAARRTRRRRSGRRCRSRGCSPRAACATSTQHLVAGGVAEAVVDHLEVVEVEEDDGDDRGPRGARVRARGGRARRTARGWRARSPGRGTPGGSSCSSKARALAHVAAVEDDAADVLVVEQVGVQDLELAGAAVAVNERALDRLLAVGTRGVLGEHLLQARAVARARRDRRSAGR